MSARELVGLHFGPSDQDRDAWLAARRLGVTATEVRDLYMGKITQADLIALKLGRRKDTFAGNAYTRWGTEREPIIAAEIERRYAIAPESRLVHAADNPRFLASPDGLALDFDGELVLSEIKTAGKPIPLGSELFAEKGYEAQMVWQMRVTGARRCLYAWELRITESVTPVAFSAGELTFEWCDYDEGLAAELERIAADFLVALDAAAAEPFSEPEIDEAVDTHAVNYLRGLDMEKQGKALKESEYRALLEAGVSQESPLARVTFTPEKPAAVLEVEEVDFEAARATAEGAALFEALQAAERAWGEHAEGFKVTRRIEGKPTAARVTVTAGKGTKQ